MLKKNSKMSISLRKIFAATALTFVMTQSTCFGDQANNSFQDANEITAIQQRLQQINKILSRQMHPRMSGGATTPTQISGALIPSKQENPLSKKLNQLAKQQ